MVITKLPLMMFRIFRSCLLNSSWNISFINNANLSSLIHVCSAAIFSNISCNRFDDSFCSFVFWPAETHPNQNELTSRIVWKNDFYSLVIQWQSWYFLSHFTISILFENNVVALHTFVDLQSHLDILNLGKILPCAHTRKNSCKAAKNSHIDYFKKLSWV